MLHLAFTIGLKHLTVTVCVVLSVKTASLV